MSNIKLVHSGGNSVSIAAPDSNPASNRTLKLPSNADGNIITSTSPDADRFKAGEIVQVVTSEFAMTTGSFPSLSSGEELFNGSLYQFLNLIKSLLDHSILEISFSK